MQGSKQILIGCIFAVLIDASYLSNGLDIEWKDPGETIGTRQTRDAPSDLPAIRDKLLNVIRFANGLALAESVALGNISFGRIVTELMVADQFANESDWVDILAAASGPELEKVLSEIGSFEGFLDGNITVDFDDSYLNDLVGTILQGEEVSLMQKEIESLKKMIDELQIKAESFDKFKDIMLGEKLESTLNIVPLLTLLPDAIQSSYKLLKNIKNISHVIDGFDAVFNMVKQNETGGLLTNINVFKEGFAKFQNSSENYQHVILPASELTKLISHSTFMKKLTLLDEITIKDTSNIALLLSFNDKDIKHLETLQNQSDVLETFQKKLDSLKWSPAKISSSKPVNSKSTFTGPAEDLQPISDTFKVLKPGSELISLAKTFSNQSHAFNNVSATPTLLSSNFLQQSKLLQSFDGLQSFIKSLKIANSEKSNANLEDLILFEQSISSQLDSVQKWLSQVEQVKVIENGVKSVEWMLKNKKDLKHFEIKQKELSILAESVNKMVNIAQAKDGFRKFAQLLVWLSKVQKWNENLLAIEEKTSGKEREEGMIIFHMSETISFLKQTLEFFNSSNITMDMITAAKQFTNLNTIENSLNYIVTYYYENKSQLEKRKRVVGDVQKALSTTANWDGVSEFNSTKEASNEEIENSLQLINDFKNGLFEMEKNKKLLDELHEDMGELDGLVKTASLMSKEDLNSFEEGIKKIKLYRPNELASSSNISSAHFSSIFQSDSDDISLLDSLVNNLRAYSDLIFGLDSVKDPIKLSNGVLGDQDVPNEMKGYLKNFQDWFVGAKNLEILSETLVELNSVSLLNKITLIKEKLQNLIDWLNAVPKDAEPARFRRSAKRSSPMSGSPQEENYLKLKNLIDKAQDPNTTEAIKQLSEDLTRLAGIFGIEEEIVTTTRVPTCQEDPSSPLCTATNPPSNVNRAHYQTHSEMVIVLTSPKAEDPWNKIAAAFAFVVLILLLAGACKFWKKIKRDRAMAAAMEADVESSSKSEPLGNVEQKQKTKKSKEKVQKSATTEVKSEKKPDKKQKEKSANELKKDKTAEMKPEDEKGIPLVRRIFPTYDPARKDLVFLTFVNAIEGEEREAAKCKACEKNECPMTMLNGKPLNRRLDRSVCQEKNRVLLTFDGKPLYINAQYITMPNGRKFIATQNPLLHTVDHFFEMLIQQKAKVVCMVRGSDTDRYYLRLFETDLFVITSDCFTTHYQFKSILCSFVKIKRKSDNKMYSFIHLWPTSWNRDIVPNFDEVVDVLELAKEIAEETPIVVHCDDGLDQTMTFIGIEYGYQRHTKSSSFIDKITILNELREMRYGAISKQPQFYFMYYGICRFWMKNKKISESLFQDLTQQYLNVLARYEGDKAAHKIKIASETEMKGYQLIQTVLPTFGYRSNDKMFTESINNLTRLKKMKCHGNAAGEEVCGNGTDPSLNRNPRLCVCDEWNRVVLIINHESQYINAQVIDSQNTKFIATQGPTQKTVDHFLRMIIEQGVKVICMLCKHMEPDPLNQNKMINVCVDYLRLNEGDGEAAVKSSSFRVVRKVVDCELKGVVRTELTIIELSNDEEYVVTHLWNTEWPEHQVPNLPFETAALMRLATTIAEKRPIVVHCSEGIGRTVAFIGVQYFFEEMTRLCGYPDRLKLIERLKNQRFGALPDVQQLYFMIFGVICMWKMDNRITEDDYSQVRLIYFETIDLLRKTKNEGKPAEEEKLKKETSKKEQSVKEKSKKEKSEKEKSKKEKSEKEKSKKEKLEKEKSKKENSKKERSKKDVTQN